MKGTPEVGYMPPSQGPFSCDGCKYFKPDNLCGNEEVAKDPDMGHTPLGTKVDPGGCCNEYEKATGKLSGLVKVSIGDGAEKE